MPAERRFPTSIEKELAFGKWCKDRGIRRFLFDLDDTLCSTRKVFQEKMGLVYDYLAGETPDVSRQKWKVEVQEVNDRLFEKFGVNPRRWDHVVDELSARHPLNEFIKQEAKGIFESIYFAPLEMIQGVNDTLKFIKKVNIPIGVVTHAERGWTWRKYNWLDLGRFVAWDEIFIVDENGHKTSESWRDALKFYGLGSNECVVVGDSPRSDINPAWEIGVKHCFLVEDPKLWSVHNQSVNAGINRIRDLSQIPDVVLESF
jgi:FMN phosphatase YigB (HAD superfamily)